MSGRAAKAAAVTVAAKTVAPARRPAAHSPHSTNAAAPAATGVLAAPSHGAWATGSTSANSCAAAAS